MSHDCPYCSMNKKVAKDYQELNQQMDEKNKRLASRLRAVRRAITALHAAMTDLAKSADPN